MFRKILMILMLGLCVMSAHAQKSSSGANGNDVSEGLPAPAPSPPATTGDTQFDGFTTTSKDSILKKLSAQKQKYSRFLLYALDEQTKQLELSLKPNRLVASLESEVTSLENQLKDHSISSEDSVTLKQELAQKQQALAAAQKVTEEISEKLQKAKIVTNHWRTESAAYSAAIGRIDSLFSQHQKAEETIGNLEASINKLKAKADMLHREALSVGTGDNSFVIVNDVRYKISDVIDESDPDWFSQNAALKTQYDAYKATPTSTERQKLEDLIRSTYEKSTTQALLEQQNQVNTLVDSQNEELTKAHSDVASTLHSVNFIENLNAELDQMNPKPFEEYEKEYPKTVWSKRKVDMIDAMSFATKEINKEVLNLLAHDNSDAYGLSGSDLDNFIERVDTQIKDMRSFLSQRPSSQDFNERFSRFLDRATTGIDSFKQTSAASREIQAQGVDLLKHAENLVSVMDTSATSRKQQEIQQAKFYALYNLDQSLATAQETNDSCLATKESDWFKDLAKTTGIETSADKIFDSTELGKLHGTLITWQKEGKISSATYNAYASDIMSLMDEADAKEVIAQAPKIEAAITHGEPIPDTDGLQSDSLLRITTDYNDALNANSDPIDRGETPSPVPATDTDPHTAPKPAPVTDPDPHTVPKPVSEPEPIDRSEHEPLMPDEVH